MAEVAREAGVDPAVGLPSEEAARRLERHGPNRLREHPRRPAWRVLVAQVQSPIIWLLVAAGAAAAAFGETLEAWAVLAVIVLTVSIGFVTELRAVRSMEALRRLGHVATRVRRDGAVAEIPAEGLVPGDVVVIEAGDVVTADLRIAEGSMLQADESALTGESVAVEKGAEPVGGEAVLAERTPMLYKGTAVTRGAGLGIVVATGMETELGAISSLVGEAGDEKTPLDERLSRLGRALIGVTLATAVAVAVSGVLAGKDAYTMVATAVALAVAAVPEGLPVVATLALARGVRRMAQQRALLNRLASVETLGSTGVIFTDKTGTLTENRMTAVRLALTSGEGPPAGRGKEKAEARDEAERRALEVAVLCNDAELSGFEGDGTGDPMEVALLTLGARTGVTPEAAQAAWPRVREVAFDPETKMMATVHGPAADAREGLYRVAVKGAPGAVLAACAAVLGPDGERLPFGDRGRQHWLERNRAMARDGLRVLALAEKRTATPDEEPYTDLVLLGLVGLEDPPRAGVADAIAACHGAGVEIVMVTGDQPATALSIAQSVGLAGAGDEAVTGAEAGDLMAAPEAAQARLLATRVFARMSPAQKLDLVRLHQRAGRIVAMTGDGVNDAPALRQADIGVAMGQRGTQVAREAADMVLLDDAFPTIVAAVREGRVVFANIRRFAFYLLSCNVSEVMVVGLAALLGMPLPLLPLQILFLNLVTDVLPALALGVGEGDPAAMRRPPRDPEEPILGRRQWAGIAAYGGVITAAVLGALAVARGFLGATEAEAVTASFLTLAFAQLWHVVNVRTWGSPIRQNEVVRNPYVWAALGLCTVALLAATYVPVLAAVLQVEPPRPAVWALVLGASLVPVAAGQAYRAVGGRAARAARSQDPD